MDTKSNLPTIFVIFGATGDLTRKKIIPALFNLFKNKKLPKYFKIIGFSRRELTDYKFRNFVKDILLSYKDKISFSETKDHFLKLFFYKRGNFKNLKTYKSLYKKIKEIEKNWGICANKLLYIAAPPDFYKTILKNIKNSGLSKDCSPEKGWSRIIIEKPFGKDLKTAKNLEKLLSSLFKEIQIYRIDHYLGKEMLQNILVFRFSNNLFENSWNNKFIEKIEIKLWEKLGVENRGNFYDEVGALRDVGQNHLLQMLALITMEHPIGFFQDSIREKRKEILETLIPPEDISEIEKFSYRAQYKGYRRIKGVKPNSTTETYFKTIAFLNHPNWKGVPIILESGKRLKEQRKEIVIYLKHPIPCLCPPATNYHYKNKITFSLEPTEGISFSLWKKKPGLSFEMEENTCICTFREKKSKLQYTEEYEKLLYDCIIGDQTLFLSSEEVSAMWRYIDPILNVWKENKPPLKIYNPDTLEPVEDSIFINDILNIKEKKFLKKEIGIIGLGKMGSNIAKRLILQGWKVVGYNKTKQKTKELEEQGLIPAYSIKELLEKLNSPRVIFIMVPAGKPVEEVIFGEDGIYNLAKKGDFIIDGGNSFYEDSIKRYKKLKEKDINFIDLGISGGPKGALTGAALMIGGDKKDFLILEPLFKALARQNGYNYFGAPGAGHFVKMVHNGIEYGMMQAIAEGFTILKKSKYKLDLKKVAEVYNNGSVIESRLIWWLKQAFELYGSDLKKISGKVSHTGEGAWTVETAKKMNIKAKVIEYALKFRILSQKNPSYTGKILSALRNQFGGHNVFEK